MNPQDPYYQPQPPAAPPTAAPTGQPYYQQPYSPAQPQPSPYANAPQPSPQPQPYAYPPQQTAPVTPLSAPLPGQDPNQYPVDYLNQIAVPIPRKPVNKFAVFGLIFGFLALAVTAAAILAGAGKPNVTAQATLMRDRVRALKIVTTEQQKHLAQNDISSLNATLTASLTSIGTDLTELLGEKVNTSNSADKPKDKTMIAFQADLSQKLNDAYLTGTLDRTYASEMSYQLELLKSQMQKLAVTGNSKAAKAFYDKNAPTIETIAQKLSDITTSQ